MSQAGIRATPSRISEQARNQLNEHYDAEGLVKYGTTMPQRTIYLASLVPRHRGDDGPSEQD